MTGEISTHHQPCWHRHPGRQCHWRHNKNNRHFGADPRQELRGQPRPPLRLRPPASSMGCMRRHHQGNSRRRPHRDDKQSRLSNMNGHIINGHTHRTAFTMSKRQRTRDETFATVLTIISSRRGTDVRTVAGKIRLLAPCLLACSNVTLFGSKLR